MKKLILITIVALISSCTLKVQKSLVNKDINHEDLYGTSCTNPIYIGTMGLKSLKKEGPMTFEDESQLSLFNILISAQEKYGKDITIQNIKYDVKNGRKVSVIFDVIKCK